MAVSANRLELLQIADAVAREKSIDRTIVVTAMEDAIAKAARSRYGAETDVHAEINPKTGELRLGRPTLGGGQVAKPSKPNRPGSARRRGRGGSATPPPTPPRRGTRAGSPRGRPRRGSCRGGAGRSATGSIRN